MSEHRPRVTVGVPVFNGESFVAETLQSLLNQTFLDLEIVVSDNASTDRTEQICQDYAARDPRVRYYREAVNRGAAWNHNRVFELAKGEYFKWNSADDLCAPEFLSECVTALDRDPDAVMAISEAVEIDENGKWLPSVSVPGQRLLPVVSPGTSAHIRFHQSILMDHLCMTIYSLFRSSVLRQTKLIDNYADSDRNLLAHAALFGPCAVIPQVLLFNRDHAGRFSRVHRDDYHAGWREQMTWFDPLNANRKHFPFWRKSLELWRMIGRNSLKWQERMRCYRVLVQWLLRKENVLRLYQDATHYPRKWVVRHFPHAKKAWNRLWGKKSVVGHVRNT